MEMINEGNKPADDIKAIKVSACIRSLGTIADSSMINRT